MAQPIYPHHGARFHIERTSAHDTSAQYDVQIYVADGLYRWNVSLSSVSNEMAWTEQHSPNPPPNPLPAWAKKHAESLLRSLLQDAKREGVWGRALRR